MAKQLVDWRHAVDDKWGGLRFGEVRVESRADQHVFEVEVLLNDLDPNAVRVELYADGINGGAAERVEMKLDGGVYRATVRSARSASDYTPRVIPQRSGVAVPLECARINWQR